MDSPAQSGCHSADSEQSEVSSDVEQVDHEMPTDSKDLRVGDLLVLFRRKSWVMWVKQCHK